MKILISAEDFWPFIGGAEVFTEELASFLAKNYDVTIAYVGDKYNKISQFKTICFSPKYALKFYLFKKTLIRQYFANILWKKRLEKIVKEIKPDLIITKLIYSPSSIDIADKYNIKSIIFLHNYEHFCPSIFRGIDPLSIKSMFDCFIKMPFSYKIQIPFIYLLQKWHKKAIINTDRIVANSNYMSKVLEHFYKRKADFVLYPIIDLEKFKVEKKSQEFITFINPTKNKGVEIFNQIINKLPDQNFLVVGGDNQWQSFNNVKHIKWCNDIKKIYSKTRLLLVPSLWYEPFGRVVLEAQINKIPVIASSRGGLKEAVGYGGIVIDNVYNIDLWARSIKKVLNKNNYKRFSKEAFNNANKYNNKNQQSRINQIVQKII